MHQLISARAYTKPVRFFTSVDARKRLKPASTEDGYKPVCSVDRPLDKGGKMNMKQSSYQLHPQQFLSSSSSFYIMLHMCILWFVSNFFAYEKKNYSEKYE